jgi:hypothetical protein
MAKYFVTPTILRSGALYMRTLLKEPSAYLPLAMALACLGLVVGHFALYGNLHEVDEGAAAHIFQILMVAQVPIVGYFAIKWLPQSPSQALQVLALWTAVVIAAFAGVYFLT